MNVQREAKTLTVKEARKRYALSLLSRSNGQLRLIRLAISEILIGRRLLPADLPVVEELKSSITHVGLTTPILVRQLDDGRLRLIDGRHRVEAQIALGEAEIDALVLSGLTDEDAELYEVVSNLHGRKLSPLQAAILYSRLLRHIEKKVSQDAAPKGGRQPREKYYQKAADQLGITADRVARAVKIARLLPEVQEKVVELNLHDNEAALLKVAAAGDTLDLQLAKAMELCNRPKKPCPKTRKGSSGAAKTRSGVAAVEAESASEMPGIPLFLDRNRDEIGYEHIKEQWGRCLDLIFAAKPENRRRFADECLMPFLDSLRAAAAHAEGVER